MALIYVVEDDKNMCEAFDFCIRGKKGFHLAAQTGKQCEGLELLRTGKMGAVILDLELDEGDGINFLNDMKELGIEKPVVIIITNNRSDITHACLRANGADFICPKYNEDYSPEKVLSVIKLLYPFRRKDVSPQMKVISYQQSQEKIYRRNRIEEELAFLGFKINVRSTGYLIDAIQYVAFEAEDPDCEMKEVYSVVALCSDVEILEFLSEQPQIHIEAVYLRFRKLLLHFDGLLDRGNAAYFRTLGVPGLFVA